MVILRRLRHLWRTLWRAIWIIHMEHGKLFLLGTNFLNGEWSSQHFCLF